MVLFATLIERNILKDSIYYFDSLAIRLRSKDYGLKTFNNFPQEMDHPDYRVSICVTGFPYEMFNIGLAIQFWPKGPASSMCSDILYVWHQFTLQSFLVVLSSSRLKLPYFKRKKENEWILSPYPKHLVDKKMKLTDSKVV